MDNPDKRVSISFKEKSQYVLAFGVIASMLLVTNFPVLVVFFFAVFAYLLLKMFSAAGRGETKDIFEFYLTSNEILRDDERRWFGFEIQETIRRGEGIALRMISPPPLILFTIGALYNKMGDHKQSISYLTRVVDAENADERSVLNPSPELRSYVRVLRKIERDPSDAPLTSSAVRALERARRMRAKAMLEDSRTMLGTGVANTSITSGENARTELRVVSSSTDNAEARIPAEPAPLSKVLNPNDRDSRDSTVTPKTQEERYSNRKPISEVLHDIYDAKVR